MEQAQLRGAVEGWLRAARADPSLVVERVSPAAHVSAELAAAWRAEKYGDGDGLEGVIPLDVVVRPSGTVPVLLKARTGAGLGRTLLPDWFERAGIRLSRPLETYGSMTEWLESREREIAIYRLQGAYPAFVEFLPRRLGDRVDTERNEYLLLVERVEQPVLMDTGEDVSGWSVDRLETMVDAAAALHAVWLGRTDELAGGPWPTVGRDAAAVVGDRELWQQLIDCGRRHFPEIVDTETHAVCSKLVETLGEWYPPRDALPHTLVHNDLNPRNACFRDDGRALVYDWELAMVDLPQRDLVELLTFTLRPGLERAAVDSLIERHRAHLGVDRDAWWEGFRIALRLEAINRVPYQWLFATAIELGYIKRITAAVQRLLREYC